MVDISIDLVFWLLAAWIVPWTINRMVPRVRRAIERSLQKAVRPDPDFETRARTITRALRRGLVILTRTAFICLFLSSIGVDMAWLATLAAASSVALGFGARSVVGDILAGLFVLAENRIRVGDDVQVNGIEGTVHEIRLRTLTLIEGDTAHFINHGAIRTVADLNFRRGGEE